VTVNSRSDLNGLVGKVTTWTNIVLLAVLALTIALVLYPSLAGAVSSPAPPPPAYEVGSRVDTPGEWHAGSDYTLLLFAQSTCGACQRAQPFLREMVEQFSGQVPMVMVSPGADRAAEVRFGESLGLHAGAVQAAPASVRARVTPTLLLVDRSGTVLHVWEGVPPDRQAAIVEALGATTGLGL